VSVWWRPLGCVLWLDFAEPDGPKAYDQSGRGNHGTVYGASRRRGPLLRALSFDGVDDYVNVPATLPVTTAVTVEAWLYLIDVPNPQGLSHIFAVEHGAYSAVPGFNLWRYEGSWRFDVSDGAVRSIYFAVDDLKRWVHLVGTYDGDVMRLYRNGDLKVSSVIGAIDITPGVARVYIGRMAYAGREWYGNIALVRVYDRALTEREIGAHYWYLKSAVQEAP